MMSEHRSISMIWRRKPRRTAFLGGFLPGRPRPDMVRKPARIIFLQWGELEALTSPLHTLKHASTDDAGDRKELAAHGAEGWPSG
ncbi:hypothetical protein [Niveispirillum sp. SYP-B3756]|uniref:hypothetical protein n=1 Tax=Niveispirillum sp. SYP-B3756 TaxID=2662178 RepID=UPI00156633ED|nr:hypothetical protein [Niveispirillum sp. SYP-B3756]